MAHEYIFEIVFMKACGGGGGLKGVSGKLVSSTLLPDCPFKAHLAKSPLVSPLLALQYPKRKKVDQIRSKSTSNVRTYRYLIINTIKYRYLYSSIFPTDVLRKYTNYPIPGIMSITYQRCAKFMTGTRTGSS